MHKMTELNRVIYDIERCICHVPDACRDCLKYMGTYTPDCMEQLLNDALKLLKEKDCAVYTDDDWSYRNYKRCEKKSSNAFLAGVIAGFLIMVIALRMEGII